MQLARRGPDVVALTSPLARSIDMSCCVSEPSADFSITTDKSSLQAEAQQRSGLGQESGRTGQCSAAAERAEASNKACKAFAR